MTKFTIIGAGMAGLLAGAILRDDCDAILEAQSELPNNHAALLRFRSSVVGDTLNIPFKPVRVIKAVASLGNPVADAISYSIKTNGSATLRSVITAQGAVEDRYIAPENFIQRMAAMCKNKVAFDIKDAFGKTYEQHRPFISTIPMPTLMRLLGYEHNAKFGSVVGYVCTAKLRDTDVCATVYLPDERELAYRASITGDKLIVEYAFPGCNEEEASEEMKRLTDYPKDRRDHLHAILAHFGMRSDRIVGVPEVKAQRYAKILPVPDDVRKRFMLWATEHHNIYSFGRFATWRPGLLMDDLVNDLRVIQRLASGGTSYDARRTA